MQVDQSFQAECSEAVKSTMYDPSTQHHHHPMDQQHLDQPDRTEQPDPSDKASLAEFPFCYNTNLTDKGQIQQIAVNTEIEKDPCSKFEASHTFNCSYAIVNQMSLANTTTYKCDICGLVFASVPLLNHHKKIHASSSISLADRIFACDVCGATFNQLCEMKTHLQTAHTTNKSCSTLVNCDNTSKKSKYTENDLSNSTNRFNQVRNHTCSKRSHTQDVCIGTEDSDRYQSEIKKGYTKKKTLATISKCPKCNGSGLIVLGNVQKAIEKPYHCNICDSTFSRYSSLWSHKRLHSGDKPFKCDLCGSTFARASSLKNHNRVHTGERPYKCNTCNMQFSQAHHLKSHERIHSGERPYECEVCSKTFARHSTLWNHRRIHTGEKPYQCDICGTAFHQATHLKNHSKVHTGEKPYRCEICGVGFSDRFALKRHRAVHEKYGQTAGDQTTHMTISHQDSWKLTHNSTTNSDLESHMYSNDTSDLNKQQSSQETSHVDMFNADTITYPGCSRPPDK